MWSKKTTYYQHLQDVTVRSFNWECQGLWLNIWHLLHYCNQKKLWLRQRSWLNSLPTEVLNRVFSMTINNKNKMASATVGLPVTGCSPVLDVNTLNFGWCGGSEKAKVTQGSPGEGVWSLKWESGAKPGIQACPGPKPMENWSDRWPTVSVCSS